jgi:hypothetical protein
MARKSDADGAAPDEEINAQEINDEIAETVETLRAEPAAQPAGIDATLVQVQALGLMMLNAVNAQQNAYIAANASVLATVNRIMAIQPAPPRRVAQQDSGAPQQQGAADA